MRSRQFLVIAFGTLLAAAVITLAYRGSGSPEHPGSRPRVIAVFKMADFSNAFWKNVRDGAVSASKDLDVDLAIRGPRDEIYVDEQIDILKGAIAEKPEAIVLAAGDYRLLVPPVQDAKRRGISVVLVDSFIETQDADARIGTDNVEAGRKCGAALLRLLPLGSVVAVMSYIKGSSTAIDREEGVRSSLARKAILLETSYSSSEIGKAYEQAKALIARNPLLAGIAALNQPTTVGAARALAESGKQDSIVLVGFDNSFEVMKFVERGIIRDTIVQKPFNMGYLSVKAAAELIARKRTTREVNTGSVDVNRGNMFQPENQKLLFPVAGGP